MSLAVPHVAVVILNWNQEALTADCLASLRKVEPNCLKGILVANGSLPESVDRLGARPPRHPIGRLSPKTGCPGRRDTGLEAPVD